MMKRASIFLVLAFAACSQPPVQELAPAPALNRVVLERTPCFGTCPIYTLSIEKGGIVHLSRQNRNAPATELTDTITPAALDLIAQRATAIDFNSFPASIRMDRELCPTQATDHPSVNFGLFGATAKQVNYYTGCYTPPTTERPGTSAGGRLAINPRLVELAAFGVFIDSLANSGRGIVKGGGGLDSVVLERSGFCFGTCPQYRLSVNAAGVVNIRRDQARQVPWPQASDGLPAADADRVDGAALDIIARRASEISFRKLPPEIAKDPRFCRGMRTDAPSVVVGLFGNDPWNVDYYTGCVTPATADSSQYPFDAYARLLDLRAFAGLIDSVANSGSHIVTGRAASTVSSSIAPSAGIRGRERY